MAAILFVQARVILGTLRCQLGKCDRIVSKTIVV